MNNTKLSQVVTSIILIALGVLIAIFGVTAVLNLYFGILFVVVGALLIVLGVVKFVTNKELVFSTTFLASALLAVGISLLANWLSFDTLINLLVILLVAFGAALFVFGIYSAVKKQLVLGISQLVIGIALVIIGVLYLTVPEFATTFWIIVGILIALYGMVMLISVLVKKSK